MTRVCDPHKGSHLFSAHPTRSVCFTVVGPLSSRLHVSAHVCAEAASDCLLSVQYPSQVKKGQRELQYPLTQGERGEINGPILWFYFQVSRATAGAIIGVDGDLLKLSIPRKNGLTVSDKLLNSNSDRDSVFGYYLMQNAAS